jgi:uncharacterized membrane protein YbaN (DUF454 family)
MSIIKPTEEFNISESKTKRIIYLILGLFFLILGIIGIFIPVLPTVIFIILAAWAFQKSSKKYYFWLMDNKYFGRLIRNYRLYKGISKKSRRNALIFLWLSLSVSCYFVNITWVRILLICVGIGVTWHLFALKTLTNEEIARLENADYQPE